MSDTSFNRSLLSDAFAASDWEALFAQGHQQMYRAGEEILAAGEPGQTILLIETGRVEISVLSRAGRKSVLAQMGPGEVLGELAALDGGPRSADAIAASAVTGRVVTRENLMRFVTTRPHLAQAVITALCQKIRNASDMFANQATSDGPARLARGLLRLFDRWGEESAEGVQLSVKFSQSEIGDFAGLARETVNRQVKIWIEAGILGLQNGQLRLNDADALRDIAD